MAVGVSALPLHRKPRVICLHGLASGTHIFRCQLGQLFSQAKGKIEFIILEGPSSCIDEEAVEIMKEYFRNAPLMRYDEEVLDGRLWRSYKEPLQALEWLQSQLRAHAPIDGVLGFSHGADFAAMLAAQSSAAVGERLGFLCLLSPNAPGYLQQLPKLFNEERLPLQVPTLLVRGEQEDYSSALKKTLAGKVVEKMGCSKPSDHLVTLFEDIEVLTHCEDHRPMPSDPHECQRISQSITRFILEKASLVSSCPLKVGCHVFCSTLPEHLQLEKGWGTIKQWHQPSRSWLIRLDETKGNVRMQKCNLQIERHCDSCQKQIVGPVAGSCFCEPCEEAFAIEQREQASLDASRFSQFLWRTNKPMQRPSWKSTEKLEFLRRFNLGPDAHMHPHFAFIEVGDSDNVVPACDRWPLKPRLSRLQGSTSLAGYTFSSAFDGGNVNHKSWKFRDKSPQGLSFSAQINPDPKASGYSKCFWFQFGVTPESPEKAIGASIALSMRGMSNQQDLFLSGYAPLCHRPSAPFWQSIDEKESVTFERAKTASGEEQNNWVLSWLFTFDEGDVHGTTYFSFCYPYSYADLMLCLARLEQSLELAKNQDIAEVVPRRISCLCPPHVETPMTVSLGRHVYFNRQLLAITPQGRAVELLTITECADVSSLCTDDDLDQLPKHLLDALGDLPSKPPPRFLDRPIFFTSARVHPGETPAQFVMLGLIQFLLSDDPRAALLRSRFVFKLVPMLNPDGVAWGHSRTSSKGHDLNRCYQHADIKEHEGVAAVKAMLLSWSQRKQLQIYVDCHGHSGVKGCFFYGNPTLEKEGDSGDLFLGNVAYVHAVQLNCPYVDIDKCSWSTAPHATATKLDYDSGRGHIGQLCQLQHAYTLECNYYVGRLTRPVPGVPGLREKYSEMQVVRGNAMNNSRFAPVPFDPRTWAAVGEALAVAALDMYGENPYSRLLVGKLPQHFTPDNRERGHDRELILALKQLFDRLAEKHSEASLRSGHVEEVEEDVPGETPAQAEEEVNELSFVNVHFDSDLVLDLYVQSGITVHELKQELAQFAFGEAKAEDIQLSMRSTSGEIAPLSDTTRLFSEHVLLEGVVKKPAEVEEGFSEELDLKVRIDMELELEVNLRVLSGITIYQLKQQLAECALEDANAKDIHLGIASASRDIVPLQDEVRVSREHLLLQILA